MKDFQRKRGWRNILESWPVLVLLGILLAFFAWGILGFIVKMQVTRENRKVAEYKTRELEEKKEKLSSDINKLKSDKGVEESIREKFGLAKEGEGMIVIIEDKNQVENVQENEMGGFFSFFTKWFK